LFGHGRASAADTITLNPFADATLFEVSPDNSGGAAWFFNSGTTQNRTRNRALLMFDIAGALPYGSLITSVELQLEVLRQPVDGFEVSFMGLHRMLRSWGEGETFADNGFGSPSAAGDATWNHRSSGQDEWAEPGGAVDVDYSGLLSSGALVYGLGTTRFEGTADLIADVQSWLDHPESNYGWMLLCQNEDLPFTARRFGSREDPNSAPTLRIEFVTVPEPGVLMLGFVGCIALKFAGRFKIHGRHGRK
jgi:hypothetical protein